MKQILGLDVGTVVFTPGGAGAGTVVISGVPGFSPARLLAITNVTRKALLYVAEGGAGAAGTWTGVSTTGGTLTLDVDTTGQNSADTLRPLYQTGLEDWPSPGGPNFLTKEASGYTLLSGCSRTLAVGPGPRPGSVFDRFTMTGASNQGFSVSEALTGRTDGVRFVLSFWAKGSGEVNISLSARSAYIVNNFYQIASLPSTWTHYQFFCLGAIAEATSIFAQLYGANNLTTTLDLADLQIEQAESGGPTAYHPPSLGASGPRPVIQTQRTSVAWWGDSLTNGANGAEPRTELSRLINGGLVYNGGVGSETSTQIAARMIPATNYNRYGTVVIWAGRNNYSSPSTVLSDIASMVAAIPHGRFLVCSVTNRTDEPIGSSAYASINTINTALASTYGSRYVDIRSLWCLGVEDDTPNPALMSDATHPNLAGAGIAAKAVYDAILSNAFALHMGQASTGAATQGTSEVSIQEAGSSLGGQNLCPVDLPGWTVAVPNSLTASASTGPLPGTKACLLDLDTTGGDNLGVNTGEIPCSGRSDGVAFCFSIWLKGPGSVTLQLVFGGPGAAYTDQAVSQDFTLSSGWARYVAKGVCRIHDASTLTAVVRRQGTGTSSVYAFGPDLRMTNEEGAPDYALPTGATQVILMRERKTTSVTAWGDTMVVGAGGYEFRTELSRLLGGAPVSNQGVAGETSTQVATRVTAATATARGLNAAGVVVIWAGKENISSPSTILTDIASMVAVMRHGRFLICGIANSTTEDHSSANYDYVNQVNRELKTRYGERFVDLAPILRGGGETPRGEYMYDTQHPNGPGYGVVASELFKAIKRNGFLEYQDLGPSTKSDLTSITSVAAAVASTSLLPSRKRRGFMITNESATANLYVALSHTASLTSYTAKILPGGILISDAGDEYTGPVTGYWDAASGNARITELL